MMGIFTSAGSLARAFGPITVGFLYKHWGPRIMMIFMLIIVLTGIISLLFNYKRLDIEAEEIDDFDDEERNITEDERFNSNNNITE
jgi:MFS family permease